jgi:hypothetical protein
MATYTTYTNGEVIASTGGAFASAPSHGVLRGVYDATKRNTVANDIIAVINVPAGTFVERVMTKILTGQATQTISVGDGDDPDGWDATASAATTGAIIVGDGALATGKLYSAADTIDIQVPATMAFTTLKVEIVAFCQFA